MCHLRNIAVRKVLPRQTVTTKTDTQTDRQMPEKAIDELFLCAAMLCR